MVVKKLPYEFLEVICQILVEALTSLVGPVQSFPVTLLIILEDVLIKVVCFGSLDIERHYTCYHNEQDNSKSKNIS